MSTPSPPNRLSPSLRQTLELIAGIKNWDEGKPLADSEINWQEWLKKYFPDVANKPMSARHENLWDWFDALKTGIAPPAKICVWPRGGAKSSSAEMGTARLCANLERRFVLYVSETQRQADAHVQSISAWLERLGVDRAINKYGNSRGFRADLLRTSNGFNVAALGLDAAGRGVKLDKFRPDCIILDDIDNETDTEKTVDKKIQIITTSIIPTGSPDCAVLAIQNLVHEDGIFARLLDGRADFLRNRDKPTVEPAIYALQTALVDRGDGQQVYKIKAGEASWEGQNLSVCENQINSWGLSAFLKEAQHEVKNASGIFFRHEKLTSIDSDKVPPLVGVCLAGDLAATEGAGDYTCFNLTGKAANGTYYVLAQIRGQWSSERVREVLNLACEHYLPKFNKPILRLPQDPAAAGKSQANDMRKELSRWNPIIKTVSGSKPKRAEGLQSEVNKGNYYLVKENLPDIFKSYITDLSWSKWHRDLTEEFRQFREDDSHKHDDGVDAAADSKNALMTGTATMTQKGKLY